MLERRVELEGGLLSCDLGVLSPDGGQVLECTLRLTAVAPERRVAVEVEALERGAVCAARIFTVPAHHEAGPRDIVLTGIRLFFPGGDGPRSLTLRADAHYVDRNERCALKR
ncbi:hypothetical protein [Flavonifractor hominis]|uniref:Uncharacterized protein n=1 Tax=Flavonifractor hominis TaxID=3133178 RepID=A0ABV1EQS0_9FIRM